MKYSLALCFILAIDFIVIALKVKYARRNKKEGAAQFANYDNAGVREDVPPVGNFANTNQQETGRGLRAN
jgi:hypothetical protein